ncbi:alpha-L-fucosidase [candidate division KSB1 bacterium]|nr:alpha-L-fucosidase [candidate division KSB1 bacterium]
MKYVTFLLQIFMMLSLSNVMAQEPYIASKENLKAREWFQDAKFGLFVHWGVYSVLQDGEWVMQVQKIDKHNYEKQAQFFNPVDFNAAEWVALAKQAGIKYITITSKHHDGFCMFDSKHIDWDIVDRTHYGRDVLKMLADECHKQDIKLFFYYSILDWYHNDYYPRGQTGQYAKRPDNGDWYAYLDYVEAQLTELLTNYGHIAGIWFDGWWDKKEADWRLDRIYKLIHDLQPHCLIGNNHHVVPKPGEDFQMFEKDLPGKSTQDYNEGSEVSELPLEMCKTMSGGGAWGFNLLDTEFKTVKENIRDLVQAAGYNSNFLLNVGPMPNGEIQPEFEDTLKAMGKWLDIFGEAIYGTRGGPILPQPWGVTTHKDNKVFIHILDWSDTAFILPQMDRKILSVKLFHNQEKVNFTEHEFGTAIELPKQYLGMIDLVLEVELE